MDGSAASLKACCTSGRFPRTDWLPNLTMFSLYGCARPSKAVPCTYVSKIFLVPRKKFSGETHSSVAPTAAPGAGSWAACPSLRASGPPHRPTWRTSGPLTCSSSYRAGCCASSTASGTASCRLSGGRGSPRPPRNHRNLSTGHRSACACPSGPGRWTRPGDRGNGGRSRHRHSAMRGSRQDESGT